MCWSFPHHYSRNRWRRLLISICFPSVSLNWHHKDIGLCHRYQQRAISMNKYFTEGIFVFSYFWNICNRMQHSFALCEGSWWTVWCSLNFKWKFSTPYPWIYLVKLVKFSTNMFATLSGLRIKPRIEARPLIFKSDALKSATESWSNHSLRGHNWFCHIKLIGIFPIWNSGNQTNDWSMN